MQWMLPLLMTLRMLLLLATHLAAFPSAVATFWSNTGSLSLFGVVSLALWLPDVLNQFNMFMLRIILICKKSQKFHRARRGENIDADSNNFMRMLSHCMALSIAFSAFLIVNYRVSQKKSTFITLTKEFLCKWIHRCYWII